MQEIEWDACLLEKRDVPEFVRRFRRETGRPDRTIRYFAGNAWLEDALIEFSVQLETHVALDPELADLAGMVVSQDNSCRYCFAAMRAFLRILGMPEARIRKLEQNLLAGEFDERERVALDFARRLSRANPLLDRPDIERLRAVGFSNPEIAELAGKVGLHLFFNRIATLGALPPQNWEELPDRWHVRLLRPLMALSLRRVRRGAATVALTPAEREGPFAYVVNGLDGLPMARALRRALDGLFTSEVLPRRTKALVFAVVGRALACPLSEQEGARLAGAEGLDQASVDEVLAHLASPALDPTERVAIPFARETVWYQPAQIQRRGQEIKQVLTRDAFVELIVTAALANVVCRLAVVTRVRP